jgi:predicted aldo/keto reductase-like oxidoreductase
MNNQKLKRRNFLRNTSLGFMGAALLGKNGFTIPSQDPDNELPKIKEYRTLGRTGFKVSDIGSGTLSNDAVIKAMLQAGVNYIDTSEYYRKGNDERKFGNAMKGMDRKKIFLTSKVRPNPMWTSSEEVIQRVRNSLERLQTDYIDCLMIHEASDSSIVGDKDFHSAMDQLKSEGKVKYIGISCHGHNWIDSGNETESMEQIFGSAIEDGRFDVFLLVYNFVNQDIGRRILNRCKEKNIGTTIMKANPIRWYATAQGILNDPENNSESYINVAKKYVDFSDRMMAYFKENNLDSSDETFRDLALPFVLSNPDVNTVLYSFNNFSDIETVISLSGKKLSLKDQAFLEHVVRDFGELHCRFGCNICESQCPNHVPVNTIMRYNYYFTLKGEEKSTMEKYMELPGGKPDMCLDCEGHCEKVCPYGVLTKPILAMAHQNLSFDIAHNT